MVLVIGAWIILSPSVTAEHYNDNVFSFDYPSDWNATTPNNKSNSSVVFLYPLSKGNSNGGVNIEVTGPQYYANLNDAKDTFIDSNSQVYIDDVNDTLVSDPGFKVLENRTVTINGLTGVVAVFKNAELATLNDPHEITEVAILQNGTKTYVLTLKCTSKAISEDSNAFKNANETFNQILNSFKVN